MEKIGVVGVSMEDTDTLTADAKTHFIVKVTINIQ